MLLRYHQRDFKGGSFSFHAFNPDNAAVFFYNPVADGESKPSAAVFGCEERRENMRQVFILDANSLVCNFHPDKSTSLGAVAANMPIRIQTCRNRQGSRTVHGLIAILHQIQKYLREPIPITPDWRKTWVEEFFDKRWAGMRFQFQRQNVFQDLVNVQWNDLQFGRTRQVEQLLNQK